MIRFSLRNRLLLAMLLVLGLVGMILWQMTHMLRSSVEQRQAFTRSLVLQELERVAIAPEGERSTLTGLRLGVARVPIEPDLSGVPAEVAVALRAQIAAAPRGAPHVVEIPGSMPRADGSPASVLYYAGVLARADGSIAWVSYPSRQPQFAERFRVFVIALAALVLALAALTLFTMLSFGREVRGLASSLRAIDADLRAEVREPRLTELREVAESIRALARNLANANDARASLADQLARRERLAGLGRVVAGVAHEVRNPLASLKLHIDLALGDATTGALQDDLRAMGREVERLDRLVTDLLVLGGRRARSRVDVALDELVRERVQLLAPWAAERGVVLNLHAISTERRALDRDAMAQALDNLLRNAVEASPAGGAVEIRAAREGQRWQVIVEDRGPGIPAERGGELFEPFFTTKAEGLGLGLATARALILAEGGDVYYARDSDVTRFTLELQVSGIETPVAKLDVA